MNRLLLFTSLLVVFAVCLALPTQGLAGDHSYVGPKKCKMCHKSAKQGEQYPKWQAGPHAKAYETLGTPEAAAAAKAKGIDNPQEADECLKCHTTGHGKSAELLGAKWAKEDGVTCEACHGFGGDYKNMKIMKDRETAVAAGLVIPTEETCKGCHNEESPTFTGFDFAKYSAKIAHPKP